MNLLNIFNSLTNMQKWLVTAILSIALFITSTGVVYSLASSAAKPTSSSSNYAKTLPSAAGTVYEDPSAPKTVECPLNGSMHTQKAKEFMDARRPLAVMVENHIEARPQSGLSYADIVYEAIAEGGITRFMGIFYCTPADIQVGPVRSARTYYLDWLSPYDPLYAHVGGANSPGPADALGQIIKYGIKDLNQFGIGFPTYWRDYQRLGHSVATEHTMYSTTQKLWDVGAKRGWGVADAKGARWDKAFISWKFKDDNASDNKQSVNINFWSNSADYVVTWDYDKGCDCYKRKNAGTVHNDLDNNQQLTAKNVVVQFERESNANDGYPGNVHLLYKTTGTGKALLFQDGKVIEGQWVKPSRLVREKFVDSAGKDIPLNRGVVWVTTVPEGAQVSY